MARSEQLTISGPALLVAQSGYRRLEPGLDPQLHGGTLAVFQLGRNAGHPRPRATPSEPCADQHRDRTYREMSGIANSGSDSVTKVLEQPQPTVR